MNGDSAFESAGVQRVSVLLDLKRYDEATREAAKALSSHPLSFQLQHLMAYGLLMSGDLAEADRFNRQAIQSEPENGDGYYLRSLILNRQLNFSGELEMAHRAARIDPECETYLGRLVEAQLQSGEVRQASLTAQQLTTLEPGSEEAHEKLANICVQLSDWDKAELHFRAVLSINPTQTHIHRNLARVLIEKRRKSEAIEVLFAALKLDPANADLQQDVYTAVNDYLPLELFTQRHKIALEALPAPIADFYTDRRQRASFFTNHSLWIYALGWILGLGLLTLFIAWSLAL